MTSAPARIQALSVWNELPQLISVLLWARLPPATRAGPRAKTEKNLADRCGDNRVEDRRVDGRRGTHEPGAVADEQPAL
jgi:hypothetical protein